MMQGCELADPLADVAKTYLIQLLREKGVMNPSQLDEACGMDSLSVIGEFMRTGAVPKNTFTVGMKTLMDEGIVDAWEDGEGWHYKLKEKTENV